MIDVHTLPSLPLVSLSLLPKCSCIYFVIQNSRIIYIGQTINLAERWTGHHRLSQLAKLDDVVVAWLECSDPNLLVEIESSLIHHFQPELNKQGQGKRCLRRAAPTHPNYRQTTIYIDKILHRQLLRSLEDSGFDGDFSEWIEQKMKSEIKNQEERSLPAEASQ